MKFSVLVERDEDGYYIASVSELPGCHTQARTLDELTSRVKEAIELYLETEGAKTEADILPPLKGCGVLVSLGFKELHL